ncbi:hypothetical protein [Ornithinibacillus sp. FSL M8-0202]|uniref:hypothetical protein n=1 Tax=Ornithinibacillus sp. FSL M8-0202 TaxID=2921616 RepID=UPI0030CFC4CA
MLYSNNAYNRMVRELAKQGYRPTKDYRAIYLLVAMDCYPAHNSRTIVSVDVEKIQ